MFFFFLIAIKVIYFIINSINYQYQSISNNTFKNCQLNLNLMKYFNFSQLLQIKTTDQCPIVAILSTSKFNLIR